MEINKSHTTEEYQFEAFKSLMEEICENGMLNEFSIPSFLSKQYNFIKDLASNVSISIRDIAKIFMNKVVFNFFSKIKWSVEYIFDLAKKGMGVKLEVGVNVGVSVGVCDGLSVGVLVGVNVGVSVGVCEGVSVGVSVTAGV